MYVHHLTDSLELARTRGGRWRLEGAHLRRFRWLAAGLGALALLALGGAQVVPVTDLVRGSAAAASETVTVAPGDTLWDIASRRYPGTDVRRKVVEIQRLNGLEGATIRPGQRLKVPAG